MGFNVAGQAVLPISHVADKAQGRYAEAERFQEQDADIADMLTQLRRQIDVLAQSPPFDPSLYNTKAQDAVNLQGKQEALGFIPLNSAVVGQAGGVVPLNAFGHIDPQYIDLTPSGNAGVTSFNGRTGATALVASDISHALGFAPANVSHTQPIGTITGLQTALDGKQAALGFTPAPASHTHALADVIGLGDYAGYSTSANANETNFPIGSIVAAYDTTGSVAVVMDDGTGNGTTVTRMFTARRSARTLYAPTIEGSNAVYSSNASIGTVIGSIGYGNPSEPATYYYTTAATGSALTGSWRSCGYISAYVYLFQRTS